MNFKINFDKLVRECKTDYMDGHIIDNIHFNIFERTFAVSYCGRKPAYKIGFTIDGVCFCVKPANKDRLWDALIDKEIIYMPLEVCNENKPQETTTSR